jgi:hypothetical protein
MGEPDEHGIYTRQSCGGELYFRLVKDALGVDNWEWSIDKLLWIPTAYVSPALRRAGAPLAERARARAAPHAPARRGVPPARRLWRRCRRSGCRRHRRAGRQLLVCHRLYAQRGRQGARQARVPGRREPARGAR